MTYKHSFLLKSLGGLRNKKRRGKSCQCHEMHGLNLQANNNNIYLTINKILLSIPQQNSMVDYMNIHIKTVKIQHKSRIKPRNIKQFILKGQSKKDRFQAPTKYLKHWGLTDPCWEGVPGLGVQQGRRPSLCPPPPCLCQWGWVGWTHRRLSADDGRGHRGICRVRQYPEPKQCRPLQVITSTLNGAQKTSGNQCNAFK